VRILFVITNNYAFLLVGLIFLFLLIPSLRMFPELRGDTLFMRVAILLGFSAMMQIGIWSLQKRKRIFRLGMGLSTMSLMLAVVAYFHRSRTADVSESLVVLLFSIVSAFVTARDVFKGNRIDRNMLYGAVCVYLLIGLIWAILYKLVIEFWPPGFTGLEVDGGTIDFDNLLYFSFVTLASLGYGDITPVAPLARTLAYFEVVTGQFYIAIMVAGLVSNYLEERREAAEAAEEAESQD
jgi:hypothetical protein